MRRKLEAPPVSHAMRLPLALLLITSLSLQGCLAALGAVAVTSALASGFLVFKAVQLSTGGSVEVAFEKISPNAVLNDRLRQITRLAVWPSDISTARIADDLVGYGSLEVLTPRDIQVAAETTGTNTDLTLLTGAERKETIAAVSEHLDANAVLVVTLSQDGAERMNMWNTSQSEESRSFTLDFYLLDPHEGRWTERGELKIKGANEPSSDEVMGIFSSSVAEKVAIALGSIAGAS